MMLSILIPARNEEYLSKTVEDLLANIEGETEIIVGLDGRWAEPPIKDHPRVGILHYSESIGQRAITNQLCQLSKAKYVMKVDAHCAFDKGFDVKMMADMHDDWTMAPTMRNLHIFNWVCPDGHTRYQGPSGPCKDCGKPTTKDVVWIPKTNPASTSYCFDSEPHFQYFNELKNRQCYQDGVDGDRELNESMSLQGSCFMMTRDKYWELNICDESFGSWGSQGIEVACKTWLSGGRVVISHKTWYAHCFRTQGGDFGFPYQISGKQVSYAKSLAKDVFFGGKWGKAIHPLSWLVEKFWPIKGWTEDDLKAIGGMVPVQESSTGTPSKGILYYTDHHINMKLGRLIRSYISQAGLPITSVTLKPLNFGTNLVCKDERGWATMFKQILMGLEAMKEDIVYFCEHDVLYAPEHFSFTPTEKERWYYNGNYWMLRKQDGFAIHYNVSPLSGLVVYRESAIKHFKERMARIEKEGFSRNIGFEPFTHRRIKWDYWCPFELFMPERPNVDIAHEGNSTWKRWKIEQFRNKPKFWEETTDFNVVGWPDLKRILA